MDIKLFRVLFSSKLISILFSGFDLNKGLLFRHIFENFTLKLCAMQYSLKIEFQM